MKSLTLYTGSRKAFNRLYLEFKYQIGLDMFDSLEEYAASILNFISSPNLIGRDCHMFSLHHIPFDYMWAIINIKKCEISDNKKRFFIKKLFKKELKKSQCDMVLNTKFIAKSWKGRKWVDISILDPGSDDEFQNSWGGLLDNQSHCGLILSQAARSALKHSPLTP